ncbi:alpha-ketoglutarate-dependent dioxygenase AlkB family protein [Flavobacterium silvaticum]|uniref:Alpha-ketoglutarate-dependent dioxygenase AlkB n=1 Tax=Flavobacterium silvaticum TaxID=1852020 RepID=A0A972JHF5_9FLAO|nr:alpha-ketoglutarate-dependent dioxygenase AlkB [Flavobacterium silvaticum]NMH27870.1 alpha-ketoglutarate-dependent dioxygenase AlkB [Flavobacterium silvaticum]
MSHFQNLLPQDGAAFYIPNAIPEPEADTFLKTLTNEIPWQNDSVTIFGKTHITRRETAWFGDSDFAYTYSGSTKVALPWTDDLLKLKQIAEERSGESFNSCLLNFYHDGNDGMGWHSDNEKTLSADSSIVSLSLGAGRNFSFRHKTSKETVSLHLQNGSLLLMKPPTQQFWHHSLPKTKKVVEPRINLTFRKFIF